MRPKNNRLGQAVSSSPSPRLPPKMSPSETGVGMDQRPYEHARGYFPRCLIWFTSSWRDTKDNRERIDSQRSSFSQFPPTHTHTPVRGEEDTAPQELQHRTAKTQKVDCRNYREKNNPILEEIHPSERWSWLKSCLINEASTFFSMMLHYISAKLL